jgi:hypothetical protein
VEEKVDGDAKSDWEDSTDEEVEGKPEIPSRVKSWDESSGAEETGE